MNTSQLWYGYRYEWYFEIDRILFMVMFFIYLSLYFDYLYLYWVLTVCHFFFFTGLKCVELKTRTTKFWRHQKDKPDTYLATIEAIYYFLRDYHEYFIPRPYRGEYDNLLFFFCFMYQKIRKFHDGGKHLKAYKNKNKMPQEVQTWYSWEDYCIPYSFVSGIRILARI